MKSVIFLNIFIFHACVVRGEFIKCPLVWVPATTGEVLPLTLNAVPASLINDQEFIGVVELESSGELTAGRFSTLTNKTYFVGANNIVQTQTSFEILTNQYNCVIEWVPGSAGIGSPHAVQVRNGGVFIGRTLGNGANPTLLPGEISNGKILFVDLNLEPITKSSNWEVLQAYSFGLRLEMTNFTFQSNPFSPTASFVGVDEIHNQGPTTVRQTVMQSTRIYEKSAVTTSSSWGLTFSVSMTIQPEISLEGEYGPIEGGITVPGNAITLETQFSISGAKSNSVVKETTKEITLTRDVTVLPFTSVLVCSTLTSVDDFIVDYTSQGKYTAPGLTGQEVADILREDGKVGEIVSDGVIIEETGIFAGSMGLTTQFLVTPIDNMGGGCAEIGELISELEVAKKARTLTKEQIKMKNKKIQKLIFG